MRSYVKKLIKKAREKKHNKGSIILLVAILAAFSSVVGVSMYSVMRSMHKNQVSKNKFTQYHLLTLSLRSIISRPDVCTLALQNQIFDPSESKSDVRIASSFFEEKKFIGNIEDISNSKFILLNQGFTADKLLANSSDKLYTYRANLQVWLPHNTEGSESFNYEKLNISIPLYVNIDEHNNINSCYGMYSKAALCERYWKTWDPSENNLDIQCNPDRQCILYTSTSCAAPAIKIAIGGIQSSTTTNSVMGEYVNVSRAYDRGKRRTERFATILAAYKRTLQEIEKSAEEAEKTVEDMRQILDQETQKYNQVVNALNACYSACNACVSGCDPDDPCNCYCDCSGAAQAAAAAAKRMNQVQKEFDEITKHHNYLVQLLAKLNKVEDINGHMIKMMELELKFAQKNLSVLDIGGVPWVGKEKVSGVFGEADPEQIAALDEELRKGFNELQLEKQRIANKYMNGEDPYAIIEMTIDDPRAGTILDTEVDVVDKRKEEISKIYSNNPNTFKHNVADLDFDSYGEITDDESVAGVYVKNSKGGKVLSAPTIMYTIYEMENEIADLSKPEKTPVTNGPVSIPEWRNNISKFQRSMESFQIQNQLLYKAYHLFAQDSKIVQQFTSPSTTVKSEPKYMCLWCNKKRKEEFTNGLTDSVLSKN